MRKRRPRRGRRASSKLLKKVPGEGTGPATVSALQRISVGCVPSRGVPVVFQQPASGASKPAFRRILLMAAAAALWAGGLANAQVALPGIFGDNMVLQRGQPVRVWGTATPKAKVSVQLGAQGATTTAEADGHWQITLEPMLAGGPYILTAASGGGTATLTNVLCGDLWLCSGQSNMQMPVQEANPAEQQAALVNLPHLRLCSVPKAPSPTPLSSAKIQWRACTPDAARNFSAVACFFAIELRKDPALTNVPLGVVDSSFGGTTCEGWIPQSALSNFSAGDLHASMFGIKPANLYNGMIAPLGQTAFKGVLWYQGESNSAHPETYPAFLASMISEWRKQFEQPNLPFLIVQLPEYANLWEGFYWPWIREKQAQAAQSIPNAALVPGIRTTDGFNLHPKEKLELGRRAALVARRVAYGEDLVAFGPQFKSAASEGSAIRVTFDSGGNGLASAAPDGVLGFALAGSDGEYHFAKAEIDGESVVVRSEEVPLPKTVRYAWGAVPQASLINQAGLPAAPFRTDSQPCSNVEVQRQQVARRVATSTYEIVIDAKGMATSLIVNGAQFLSNEPGAAGGSSIPGFWGPRALGDIREMGPQLLRCQDQEVTVQMLFGEKSMEWAITNGGKEPITFQLALSPQVKAPDSISEGKATLTRGKAVLKVQGFDTITNTATGALLKTSIKSGDARTIAFE
jgi:sialate O-acetylesterase